MKFHSPSIAWLLALFLILASSYSIVNPLFEAPDEVWHYELVRWLKEGKGLPVPEDIGNAPWEQEGAQPPLYYWLGAALTSGIATDNASTVIRYNPHANVGNAAAQDNKNIMAHGHWENWPWRGVVLAVHLVRLLSVGLGMVTILFVWKTARLIFPDSHSLAWLAAALVALNPQFLFISASVTNDVAITCFAVVGIWLLTHLLHNHWESQSTPTMLQLSGLGSVLGAAALSKVSGLALSGLAGIVLVLLAWRARKFHALIRMGLGTYAVAALVAGWWYWRNWQLFGDPLAIEVLTSVLPGRDQPLNWGEILSLAPGVWRSYWGVFGWFNILMDNWLYRFYDILALLGVVGMLVGMRKLWRTWRGLVSLLLVAWILLIGALVVRWAQINYPQGRLLFPAEGALTILLAYGLQSLSPKRFHSVIASLLTVALLLPAAVAPWRWIAPTYRIPLPSTENSVQQPLAVSFGDELQLHGYTQISDTVTVGGEWTTTLFWSAPKTLETNYSIFVHLTDGNGVLLAQSDSFPAGGALPTSALLPGQIVPDMHGLQIPPSVPPNTLLQVEVGVYDYATGSRLAVGNGDTITLGTLNVLGKRQADGSPVAINFENKIELINYTIDRTLVEPDSSLAIDLTWRSLAPMDTNYVVFVHLLLPPDSVWAQIDEQPDHGKQPTSTWQEGQIVEEQHILNIPDSVPPGIYHIEIGLYDSETMDRLKVNLEDKGILIGSVRVQ